MYEKKCDICTLASKLENNDEYKNKNIVKVVTTKSIENSNFLEAIKNCPFFNSSKAS